MNPSDEAVRIVMEQFGRELKEAGERFRAGIEAALSPLDQRVPPPPTE